MDKRVLKRQVSNTKFVVREEIIEEYLDDEEEEEENELLVKEARNLDLRYSVGLGPVKIKSFTDKSFVNLAPHTFKESCFLFFLCSESGLYHSISDPKWNRG